MAINFPDNPNVNDTHTASGCTWKWDGTSWSIYSSVSTGIGFSDLSVSQQAASGSGSLTYNNAGIFTYTPPAGGGGGSSTFTGLSDTPSSLTAGKWLKVNTGGTALEWTDAPSGGGVTYALTAGGGSVVTEEKIYLTGSGGTEDAVILAVDANSGLTIERANSKITFGSTVANENTDTECYPLFTTEATGNLAPKTVTSFKLNSSSGQLEAGSFKKTGGTNTEFLKADGSIDSTAYSTTGHTHSYALNDLTNVDAVTGAANGKILKYNGASWELADDLSGGGNFTGLSDTPNSLTAGKWLKVNAGGTALEWTDAFSGSYTDLTNKPTIPAAQVNSDWNATSGNIAFILNKPTLFSGSYTDLTNKPTLFSGSYNDLTNKPTIPSTLNDLSNVDAVTGVANGKILKYNGTSWEVADDISSGSGSSTFTALTDTPNSYTALRWLRVNSGGNALEWEVLPVSVVNNNADNRLITGSATFGELNCEANLTFDGTKLNLGDDKKITFGNNLRMEIYTDGSNNYIQLPADGGGAFPFTIKSNTIDALKIDSSGNTIIGGNLTVNGTTTTVNSNTVNIGDNILVLNSDETGTPSQAAGIEVERGTSDNVSLRWNESETKWQYTNDGTNFNDITSSAAQVQSDWNATSGLGEILNKPTLFSGSYTDLTNKPTIPAAQVNSDWNATSGNVAFILNKPTLFSGAYNDLTGKPTLFSGSYNDLTNKPTIPAAQIQSDWNQATTSALDYIKNKPTIPTNNTQLTNGAGYISSYTDTNDYVNGLSLSGTTLTASFSNTSLNKTVDLSSLSGGSFSGGMIMMWYGSSGNVPSGWVICDGSNSTPDLRDKFILGANPNSSPSQSSEGGSHDAIVVSHSHGIGNISGNTGNHNGHTHGDGNYNADLAGSHTHSFNTGNQSANHVHTFSHNINTGTQGAHTHSYNTASWDNQSDYTGPYVQGGSNQGSRNTNSGGGHSHNFNITADTLGISANHTHSGNTSPPLTTSEHNHGVSGNSGSGGSHSHNVSISGNTGSNGSGGSGANKPKYYALYYIMKT